MKDTSPLDALIWKSAASAPPETDQATAVLAVSVTTAVAGAVTVTELPPVITGGVGTVTAIVFVLAFPEPSVATTVTE